MYIIIFFFTVKMALIKALEIISRKYYTLNMQKWPKIAHKSPELKKYPIKMEENGNSANYLCKIRDFKAYLSF